MAGNLFTCHWDESGTDPGTSGKSKADILIILVGGYFAHVNEWVNFDKRWTIILAEHNLEDFHMAAFANKQWPYSSMSDDEYNALIKAVLDAIADFPRFRHGVGILVDDYREIVKADNIGRDDIVRAYHMCARKCIELISDLAREANHQTPILHIFDAGNAAWPSFEDTFTDAMLDKLKILRPIQQRKKDVLGLQAADVLAHQTARHKLVELGKSSAPIRLYTDRLHAKPGFTLCATRNEVRAWYSEELYLEGHRTLGTYPPRVTRIDLRPFAPILAQLFANPEDQDPHFVSSLRSLQ